MLTRLLKRPRNADRDEIKHPMAFLNKAIRNAALDAIRQRNQQREVLLDEHAADRNPLLSPDDTIAQWLDQDASRTTIVAAMQTAAEQGEHALVRIITIWLDTAESLGKIPTTREVADRTDVSHATVAKALKRFREFVGEAP